MMRTAGREICRQDLQLKRVGANCTTHVKLIAVRKAVAEVGRIRPSKKSAKLD
jgi:hypothetical protein